MQLQTTAVGEAVPKRLRTRKRQWLVMSEGQTLAARAIKQLMLGPRLLSNAMPRVMPDVEKLREAGVNVGPPSSRLKWWGPDRDQITGRKKVVKNFESGEPERKPDKYFFNSVQVDPAKHTAVVNKPVLVVVGSALGPPSNEVTALSERREASATRPKIRTS